jgi:hypothetical protein
MDKISEGPVFLPMFLQWAESTSAVDISTPDGLEDAVDRFFATEGITSNKQTLIDSVTRNQVPRPGAFVLGKKSFVPTVFRHKSDWEPGPPVTENDKTCLQNYEWHAPDDSSVTRNYRRRAPHTFAPIENPTDMYAEQCTNCGYRND